MTHDTHAFQDNANKQKSNYHNGPVQDVSTGKDDGQPITLTKLVHVNTSTNKHEHHIRKTAQDIQHHQYKKSLQNQLKA